MTLLEAEPRGICTMRHPERVEGSLITKQSVGILDPEFVRIMFA